MPFANNSQALLPVAHLASIELIDSAGHSVGRIENKPGQAGSLAVYVTLAGRYGYIDAAAASEGLRLYAEHTDDARANPGKHPNIDRLLAIAAGGPALQVTLHPA